MKKNKPSVSAGNVGKHGEYKLISYLLKQVSAVFSLQIERALAKYKLTGPQFAILGLIRSHRGISSADLARRSLKTRQTISVIVANLEKMELISRHSHAIHKKIQQLEITDKGLVLHNQCREAVWETEKELLMDNSYENEGMIRNWLLQVVSHHGSMEELQEIDG